jgi:arginyl-tRNA--protein-N-Asp/Glu arginylyltransferase
MCNHEYDVCGVVKVWAVGETHVTKTLEISKETSLRHRSGFKTHSKHTLESIKEELKLKDFDFSANIAYRFKCQHCGDEQQVN